MENKQKRILVIALGSLIFCGLLFILLNLLLVNYRLNIGDQSSSRITFLPPIASLTNSLGVAFFGIRSTAPAKPEGPEVIYRTQKQKYTLLSDKCTVEECLTQIPGDELYGTAFIGGYYTKSTREFFGKESVCDSFVITGHTTLRGYFSNLIGKGNTVNSFNEYKEPVINVDLSSLNSTDREGIIKSTQDNQVSLLVLKRTESGRGAPRCFSSVDILKVNTSPKTYSNLSFGYEFQYPPNLITTQDSSDKSVILSDSKNGYWAYSVSTASNLGNLSLEDVFTSRTSKYNGSEDPVTIKAQDIKIDGKPAKRFWRVGYHDYGNTGVYLLNQGNVIEIYGDDSSSYAALAFNTILNSFKFSKNALERLTFSSFDQWKTYSNQDMGISLKYPPELFTGNRDGMIVFEPFAPNDPQQKEEGEILTELHISLIDKTASWALEERKNGDLRNFSVSDIQVSKIQAKKISYQDVFAGGMFYEILVPKGNQTIFIWYSDLRVTKSTYDKMLQTVELTNK